MSQWKINEVGWKTAFGSVDQQFFKTNISLSPPGLYIMLASISNGLGGIEALELKKFLKSDYTSIFNYIKTHKSKKIKNALAALQKNSSPIFGVLHAFDLDPDYKRVIQNNFPTTFIPADFYTPGISTSVANSWITFNTQGVLKDCLYEQFPQETNYIAINALVFKGEWMDPFDRDRMEIDAFYVDQYTIIDIPLMIRDGFYKYYKSKAKNLAVIFLPYKQEGLSAVFIRPDAKKRLMKVAKKLKVFLN